MAYSRLHSINGPNILPCQFSWNKFRAFFPSFYKFSAIYALPWPRSTWRNVNLYMLNPTRISMSGGRSGTPELRYNRTMREQEYQEDREARLDIQRLQRTNQLTPGQRWVPLLFTNICTNKSCLDLRISHTLNPSSNHFGSKFLFNFQRQPQLQL